MRVDTLKKWTDFRCEVVAISRAISTAQTQPTPMDIGAVGKGTTSKGGKGAKGGGKRNNAETQITLQQTALTPTRRAENAERSVIWRVRVDLLEHRSPKEGGKKGKVGKGAGMVQAWPKRIVVVARLGTCRPSVPRRRSWRWKI